MRRIVPLLALITLSLGLVGCARWRGERVAFTVVDEGDTASDYPDRQGMCIDSLSGWRSLWEQLHRYTIPKPTLPEIDFTQYMLIVVFAGEDDNQHILREVDLRKSRFRDCVAM